MKDPAVLIYFDKWISSTNGMRADFRAWYFDLIVHQYDKGHVPSDVDEMAGICRVRPSEYESFKQMVDQVVSQKFDLIDGFYKNSVIGEIISKRQEFKDKREKSGNIGVVVKMAKAFKIYPVEVVERLKLHLYTLSVEDIINLKDNHVLEQMLNQMLKLYINEDVDLDKEYKKGNIEIFKEEALKDLQWLEIVGMQNKIHPDKINFALADFNKHLISQSRLKDVLSIDDYKRFFANWVRKRKEIQARQQN